MLRGWGQSCCRRHFWIQLLIFFLEHIKTFLFFSNPYIAIKMRITTAVLWLASIFGCFCDVNADIGLLSFWVPELYALLAQIESEGNPVETYIFGARKFYVTTYRGHNVVIANTGVGISNSAATTATMLQKFPSITRIIGSGIAGGVVSTVFCNSGGMVLSYH